MTCDGCDETRLTKKKKTLYAYTKATEYFAESCRKRYLSEIERIPVVKLDEDGERELTLMRWGLIPFFSRMTSQLSNRRAQEPRTEADFWLPINSRRMTWRLCTLR